MLWESNSLKGELWDRKEAVFLVPLPSEQLWVLREATSVQFRVSVRRPAYRNSDPTKANCNHVALDHLQHRLISLRGTWLSDYTKVLTPSLKLAELSV